MASKEELITLHKYFLNASAMKMEFDKVLKAQGAPEDLSKAVDHWIYLSLWYGCLRVVLEGWQSLGLKDDAVDCLIDESKITLLNGFRNDVFHYKPDYYSKRTEKLLADKDVVEWIRKIHDPLGSAILIFMKK